MKTITLENPGKFAVLDTPAPDSPAPGEALVRVRRVGVCGTDLNAYRGRQPFFTYPRVLGHELGVEVLSINGGAGGEIQPGDQCAVEPYLNCGKCIACRRGRTNCCVSLKTLGVHIDGGMREIIRIPINKLHKSTKLSLDQLALIETLGVGAHAVDRAKLELGEWVLVIGAGPIGLSVMQFAQLAGVKLIAMDVSSQRLTFAQKLFGIEHTILAGNIEKAFETLKTITQNELPTAVFDATGNANSMMNAFGCTAHSGRLVLVGLVLGEITFSHRDFHRREHTLLATRNSTSADFKRILSLLESGLINATPWITHRCQSDSMIAQFDHWLKPENRCVKAIVEF